MAGIESNVFGATNQAFGFNASLISGLPRDRAAEMTGGGGYNLDLAFVAAGGEFRCLSNIVVGQFSGCLAGEGLRWDAVAVLGSTTFQCTAFDAVKTALTADKTVVLVSDLYRQGDGTVASFTAKMIISDVDLDKVTPGVQNVFVQGIGCATDAVISFN
jgi:hypothetical protein